MEINYLDLFSGIGGFSLGLKEAGFVFKNHYFSEIDKYSISVYKNNFKNSIFLGDILNAKTEKIEKPDIITFGFPCQDLSIAGKRRGIDGHRSSLFFDAIEIIEKSQPKFFIFENVKGLFSSTKGEDFIKVLETISNIGYYGQWQLLNTKWFLPQNRERVYFIGYPRNRCFGKIFFIKETYGELTKTQGKTQGKGSRIWYANTLLSRYYKDGSENLIQVGNVDTKGNNSMWGRVYSPEGCSATLTDGGGLGAKTGLYEIPEATSKGFAVAEEGDSVNLTCIGSSTRRGRVRKGEANTIDTGVQQYTVQKTNIRRLTPIECERLQGFPDNWTKYGIEGEEISDTQRYKQLGNAVSVPVAKAVAEKIMENIDEK